MYTEKADVEDMVEGVYYPSRVEESFRLVESKDLELVEGAIPELDECDDKFAATSHTDNTMYSGFHWVGPKEEVKSFADGLIHDSFSH